MFKLNVRIVALHILRIFTNILVDDPEAYHGAPVAVQIIGRRLTEERIMEIAEEVGRVLGNEITP